jgi:hypothetical protein
VQAVCTLQDEILKTSCVLRQLLPAHILQNNTPLHATTPLSLTSIANADRHGDKALINETAATVAPARRSACLLASQPSLLAAAPSVLRARPVLFVIWTAHAQLML